MSTVLVTGAAGFIGSHTCDRLLAAVHAAAKPADIRHSLGAPGLARTEFGFAAEISLEAGLAATLRGAGHQQARSAA